jgi:hypothetical protein
MNHTAFVSVEAAASSAVVSMSVVAGSAPFPVGA